MARQTAASESEPEAPRQAGVVEVALTAGAFSLSGLYAAPAPAASPRALIVALHGGGTNSAYFDGRTDPSLSLLRLAATTGFSALAVDRPGYGASRQAMPEGQELAEQALTVWAAIEAFADSHDVGAGVFLVGHSHGMRLAVHVAADSRGRHLLGLEASGAGIRFSREFLDRYPAVEPGSPEALRIVQDHRHLFWGPRQLYPPRTFERGTLPVEPIPKNDLMEARLWPGTYPELAARVQVPVQISMAEFEQFWDMSETAAAETRALYERAPHVAIRTQAAAGHNISLSWAARSYHLQLLAFAEQCVLWGSRPSPVVVKEAGPLS